MCIKESLRLHNPVPLITRTLTHSVKLPNNITLPPGKGELRQDKTRQDKTRQDKTRQDKTRQDKTREDKIRLFHAVIKIVPWN